MQESKTHEVSRFMIDNMKEKKKVESRKITYKWRN